jgi:sulfur carrier protein ThiS
VTRGGRFELPEGCPNQISSLAPLAAWLPAQRNREKGHLHKALVQSPGVLRVTLRRLGPERGEQSLALPAGSVVRDALVRAGIHPETVLVARGAPPTIVPDDEPLRDGDTLLVTRVVTGGGLGQHPR